MGKIGRVGLLVVAVVYLGLVILPRFGEAAGPWKAQIVDAETKQPLEGVVVVAAWFKATRSPGGFGEDYYDSEEVQTGKDGRFVIAARRFFTLNPLAFFRGPKFTIFKPGYGRPVWPGDREAESWPEAQRKAVSTYAGLLQRDGIVLEMAPLRTIQERRALMESGGYGPPCCGVPREKTPLLNKALDEDRVAVGLPPGHSK